MPWHQVFFGVLTVLPFSYSLIQLERANKRDAPGRTMISWWGLLLFWLFIMIAAWGGGYVHIRID